MALAARTAARAVAGILCPVGASWPSPPARAPSERARRMRRRPIRLPKARDGAVELTWRRRHGRHPLRHPLGQRPGPVDVRQRDHGHRGHELRPHGTRELPPVPLQDRGGDQRRTRPGKHGGQRATPGPVAGLDRMDGRDQPRTRATRSISPTTTDATHYRVYFAGLESQLVGLRPNAQFVEAEASPHVRDDIAITTRALLPRDRDERHAHRPRRPDRSFARQGHQRTQSPDRRRRVRRSRTTTAASTCRRRSAASTRASAPAASRRGCLPTRASPT